MSRLWDPVGWLLRRRAPDEDPRRKVRWTGRMARRWRVAAAHDAGLVQDVIALGGVLAPPMLRDDGTDLLAMTEGELAFEAGRRAMALELLSLMNVGAHELSTLMEDDRHGHADDGPVELLDAADLGPLG